MRLSIAALFFFFSRLCLADDAALSVPTAGDRFLIHQETVTTGTASLEDLPLEPLAQKFEVWGQALVLEADPKTGMKIRYTFDRILVDVTIEGQGSCQLEVLPGKAILDGTPVYDRERNPDLPVGLFDLIINEEIEVKLDPQFEEEEIRQFRRNRSKRSHLDLLSVVRQSIVPTPPLEIEVGESWVVVRPMESLGGDFVLPATETYRYNQPATDTQPIRVLQRTVVAHLDQPKRVPIRMGVLTTENLRFDALGPNLTSPPPDMKILKFDYESKEILEVNKAWGFTQKVGSISEVRMASEVPPPDGIEMKTKNLVLNRSTLLTVEKAPDLQLTDEERALLLGLGMPSETD